MNIMLIINQPVNKRKYKTQHNIQITHHIHTQQKHSNKVGKRSPRIAIQEKPLSLPLYQKPED